jgi:hypothetical protein
LRLWPWSVMSGLIVLIIGYTRRRPPAPPQG